jgi:hypothetical protein
MREAAVGVAKKATAKIVLPAGIQAQFLAHSGAVSVKEPQKTTDVIIVAVADDQRVHLANINLEKLKVVRINIRRKAEVQQIAARLLRLA